MQTHASRYAPPAPASTAEGWTIERVTPPSRLFGANGLRTGPDGRIYVAQVSGSQISAIDVATGAIETVSAMGGPIVAPDDLVFDDLGNLYATEITEGRVGMLSPDGRYRVLYGESPVANPITFHQGRLISGECRPGGRILELDRDGGSPRVILADVPMPNAFAVGPDGKLYVPVMATNEIWRVDLAGGAPEIVAGDLGVPDSVKFDPAGFLVSTQVASGQVLRIDPRTGARTVLAELSPGLDNCTFVGERLFVSNISGSIIEILGAGATCDLVPDGLSWPLGLAVDPDGLMFVADGPFAYTIAPDRDRQLAGMLFTPGYPGYTRGAAALGPGAFLVTTANGDVARFRPAEAASDIVASGFDQLYGVAVGATGAIAFAELGRGRVHACEGGTVTLLADGLAEPKGVAIDDDQRVYAAEAGAGHVVRLAGSRADIVADGFGRPEGIIVRGDELLVVDAAAKTLVSCDLVTGRREVIAAGLPVGAPAGVVPKPLGSIGTLSGPMGPFAAIAAATDGTLYVSGDAEGSVLALRRA